MKSMRDDSPPSATTLHPERLVLGVGARLWRLRYLHDPDTNQGSHARSDVTNEASAWLFEAVELDPGLTLRDVFRFVQADKVLRAVLERQWADELLQEASPYLGSGNEEMPTGQSLVLTVAGKAGGDRLQLQGVGFDLRDVLDFAGIPAAFFDEVNAWKLDPSVAWRFLDLPLRLDGTTSAVGADTGSGPGDGQGATPAGAQPTLGDVLRAVFDGLSCLAGARERRPELNKADGRLEEVDDVDVGTLLKRIFAGPLDEDLAG